MADDQYCVFVYQYGDSDNISKPGRLLLSGMHDAEVERAIRTACECWEYFVAEQIDVPVLYSELYALSGGPTVDDVAFHEFLGMRQATDEEVTLLPVWGDLSSFVSRFRAVRYWDCRLSPHCS
ncbi:hypothetical protein ACVWWQ_000895 [Rhodanobacter sp. TND4EL1]